MGNTDGNAYPFRRWAAAAALAGLSLIAEPALAERVSKSEMDAFRGFMDASTGRSFTLGMSKSGVPIATAAKPGGTPVGNMSFQHSAGGWPTAAGNANLPTPIPGKQLPVTATQAFDKARTARALGEFAKKTFFPLAAGLAIYDLAKELGFGMRKRADGTVEYFEEVKTYECPSANYGTSTHASNSAVTSTKFCVPTSAGSTTFAFGWSHQSGTYGWPGVSFPCGNYSCKTGYVEDLLGYTTGVVGGYEVAKTEDDFVARIAAQAGWPSGSKILPAVVDMVNAGIEIETDGAPLVTSPQTQVVSDPKTTTLSDGTTQTETETCSWVQGIPPGPLQWNCWKNTTTVTPQKTTTETVVKSNPDGTTSTETITKITPSTTVTGTTTAATPTEEKLCADGSRRLVCSDLDTVAQDMPKATHTVTYAADNLGFGGGSCPAPYTWSDSMGSHQVDLSPLCAKLSSVVRPLVIAFALLLAVFIVLPRES